MTIVTAACSMSVQLLMRLSNLYTKQWWHWVVACSLPTIKMS